MFLLDTNVLSELLREMPEARVVSFLKSCRADSVFTAVMCQAEIRYGVARLPPGRRRELLAERIAALFSEGLAGQVLPFQSDDTTHYAEIRARREASGRPISVPDALIAATAVGYGATLVTRNVRDFSDCGIALVDPWVNPQA